MDFISYLSGGDRFSILGIGDMVVGAFFFSPFYFFLLSCDDSHVHEGEHIHMLVCVFAYLVAWEESHSKGSDFRDPSII